MPRTSQILEKLGFIHFSNYTAVGPNSGPNQKALYSGIPLQGRNGIKPDINGQWLWDRLKTSGYATLKTEDNCVLNSNMIRSLAPNTTHGAALQGLFCFDAFSRPNCIGQDPASSLLLKYGEQFMKAYERNGQKWAAFLHLTDSHEDTKLLAASLDEPVSLFLKNLNLFPDTTVIVCSDHGLHYGPSFPTKQAQREATEPILYVKIPSKLYSKATIEKNSMLYTTPFDVHETLLQVSHTAESDGMQTRKGRSFTRELPENRRQCAASTDLIPESYCMLRRQNENDLSVDEQGVVMPSMNTFFLDIPPGRRPKLKMDPDCRKGNRDDFGAGFHICREFNSEGCNRG